MRLDEIKRGADIEVVDESKKALTYTTLRNYRPSIDGGFIFEYDPSTISLTKLELQDTGEYVLGGSNNKKLHTRPGCLYVEALNLKSAWKRVKQNRFL